MNGGEGVNTDHTLGSQRKTEDQPRCGTGEGSRVTPMMNNKELNHCDLELHNTALVSAEVCPAVEWLGDTISNAENDGTVLIQICRSFVHRDRDNCLCSNGREVCTPWPVDKSLPLKAFHVTIDRGYSLSILAGVIRFFEVYPDTWQLPCEGLSQATEFTYCPC